MTAEIKYAVNGINAPKAVFSGYHSQPIASISGKVNPELKPTISDAATMPDGEPLSSPKVSAMAEIAFPTHILTGDVAFTLGEIIIRHMAMPSHIADNA